MSSKHKHELVHFSELDFCVADAAQAPASCLYELCTHTWALLRNHVRSTQKLVN